MARRLSLFLALAGLMAVFCHDGNAALPVTLQWDVRTTGVDTSGGAFDPSVSSPGTDFSQQSAAQIAYSDLIISATTTNYTSVLNPVTSAVVGIRGSWLTPSGTQHHLRMRVLLIVGFASPSFRIH
jgi:hypothetical protein